MSFTKLDNLLGLCISIILIGLLASPSAAQAVWQDKPWVRKYLCGYGYPNYIPSMETTPFWIDSFRGTWNSDTNGGSSGLELEILAVHNGSLITCDEIDVAFLKDSLGFQVLGRSVGKLESFESKCPLPITDRLRPTGKMLFNSYRLLYSFEGTHKFQTLESTFRFNHKNGQELDCGMAKITPDLGKSISAALTFTSFSILIVIVLSSWRVNQGSLSYGYALDSGSLWPIVLDMTNYLRYLQFAFISAVLSVEYPGFFVPAVSKLAWASLLYWQGPFNYGYFYEGPDGGMYANNASFGLGQMTQMLRYPNMLNTLANSLINLIILTAPIFFFLSVSYWTFSRSNPSHSRPFVPIIQKAATTTIGISLCFFSVPLLSYISYDLIMIGYLPNYRIGLAIIMILVIIGASHFLRQVLRTQIEDKPRPLRDNDSELDGHVLDFHWVGWFLSRHISHTMPLIQAIGVGGLQAYPVGQLIVLLACECLILVFHLTSRRSPRIMTSVTLYVLLIRLLSVLLLGVLILPVSGGARQWIGYVILSLHALVIVAGFLIRHLWKLYKSVSKTPAVNQNGTVDAPNLVTTFHMDSLELHSTADLLDYRQTYSRELPRQNFQPDPASFYRPPRSRAVSPTFQAPKPAAVSRTPASERCANERTFSLEMALSEVSVDPGVDYSFRESDRFYGIDEERVFITPAPSPDQVSTSGSSSDGGHHRPDGNRLLKAAAGVASTFSRPKPKIQEKGFQVKRPPRPPP